MELETGRYPRPHLERRKQTRISCHFPANLSIVLPEETFTPYSTIVFVRDVSPIGVMVQCPLGKERWIRKLKEGLYCRLMAYKGQEIGRLFCRIARISGPQGPEGREFVELGLLYDLVDPLTVRGIPVVMDRAEETESQPGTT